MELSSPPPPQWTFQLHKSSEVILYLPTAPNGFHRLMQRAAFGFVWKRLNTERTNGK
jgi:hypothetical protein